MKKFLIGIVIATALILVLLPGLAKADDFDIALTTNVPTASADNATADITGNIKIDKVTLSNAGTTVQVVTIYELATSSTTASSRLVIDVPSNAVDGPIILDWPYSNPMIIHDLAIRKLSASSVVNAYILYR